MKNPKEVIVLLPTVGIFIFLALSIYATDLYPGGSQADADSIGFDWYNNYWCNLMSENAMNGLKNPAKPVAMTAAIVLCLSMILFFFQFAKRFVESRIWKTTIVITGVVSMVSAVFAFTNYHDVMTSILSIGGVIGMTGIIRTLYKNQMTFYLICGVCCMVIVGLNNLFYFNDDLIVYLPVLQKISFVLILAWTIGLNFKMKEKHPQSPDLDAI